jgi:hypothetical protein
MLSALYPNFLASDSHVRNASRMPKPPDQRELIAHARRMAAALGSPGSGRTGEATNGVEFLRKYAGPDSSHYRAASSFAEGLINLRSAAAENAIIGIGLLLASWADYADSGLATAPAFDLAARTEAANDLMEQAESLLADGKVHNAVPVMIAGAALEELLRGLHTTTSEPLPSMSITNYGVALQKAGIIEAKDSKELLSLAAIRNDAAHGHFEKITEDDARVFVSRVNLFLGKHTPS